MAPVDSTPTTFATPPPATQYALLSFPAPQVLLVTLNRPDALNCINMAGHAELDRVWSWLDAEPSLRVGIITGQGRAFCAGADLREWNTNTGGGSGASSSSAAGSAPPMLPTSGFGGLSRRSGVKPVIAAVNGICYGGGCEMAVNADIVLAAAGARFALPEVKRGVVAFAGALPRLVRTVGRQRAMYTALTGEPLTAEEARDWGLVNRVVPPDEKGGVVGAAVKIASVIAANSPDAVIVSREGVKMGLEGMGTEEATRLWNEQWAARLFAGENMKEGLRAFVEKRKPVWKAAKL